MLHADFYYLCTEKKLVYVFIKASVSAATVFVFDPAAEIKLEFTGTKFIRGGTWFTFAHNSTSQLANVIQVHVTIFYRGCFIFFSCSLGLFEMAIRAGWKIRRPLYWAHKYSLSGIAAPVKCAQEPLQILLSGNLKKTKLTHFLYFPWAMYCC